MTDLEMTAGKEIDAKCTRCKRVTPHRIVAMVEEQPKRVRCQSCSSEHRYIAPLHEKKKAVASTVIEKEGRRRTLRTVAGDSPAPKKKPAKAKPTPAQKHEEAFLKLCEDKELELPRPYFPKEAFEQDQLIEHKVFGTGLVTRQKGSGKIEVHFRTLGIKVLVHAG